MEAFAILGTALGASSATAGMAGLMATSAGVSAIGALQQGRAQSAQYRSAAEAAEYNALIARQNEQTAGAQASVAEEQQRRKFRAMQGEAIAGMAQTGTGLDGSNADVLRQASIANELDALTIRYEGQMKARGLMAQSELDRMSAASSRRAGSSAMTGAFLNAGAGLLSGASKYYAATRPSMKVE